MGIIYFRLVLKKIWDSHAFVLSVIARSVATRQSQNKCSEWRFITSLKYIISKLILIFALCILHFELFFLSLPKVWVNVHLSPHNPARNSASIGVQRGGSARIKRPLHGCVAVFFVRWETRDERRVAQTKMAMNDIRAFSPEWQAQSKIAEWHRMAKEKKLP